MKKNGIVGFAILLIILVLTLVVTSLPAVQANYPGIDENCYCDHPYNEWYYDNNQYYDVWTGNTVKGYYGDPSSSYHYDWADYDFQSGRGGYSEYVATSPLTCNWQYRSTGFETYYGQYIDYSYNYQPTTEWGVFGYRDEVSIHNVYIADSVATYDQAFCTFKCPPPPPGPFPWTGLYWTGGQYAWCGVEASGPNPPSIHITIQSSPNGATDPGPGMHETTNGAFIINAYPNLGWSFTGWQITYEGNTWTQYDNPLWISYDYAIVRPIFEISNPNYMHVTIQSSYGGTTDPGPGYYVTY